MALDRREFIRASLDLALLAAAAGAGVATPAMGAVSRPALLTLFDARFPEARKTAVAWANGAPVQALGSDITDVVLNLGQLMRASPPCQIAGVTTEHVPFCLQQLARRPTLMRLSLQRMNRDLFVWTLTNEGPNA